MKLSAKTLAILQHYQSINNSVILEKGSTLRVLSPNETVFAKTTIEEEFPADVGVYDISSFISTIKLFNDPEIKFHEHKMVIDDGEQCLHFVLSDPALIGAPEIDWEPEIEDEICKFELTNDMLQKFIKGMRVFKYEVFSIIGRKGELILSASEQNNPDSNEYNLRLGDTKETFKVTLEYDSIKILPDDYMVRVDENMIELKSNISKYWITTQKDS